jgi:hypothetical protein
VRGALVERGDVRIEKPMNECFAIEFSKLKI